MEKDAFYFPHFSNARNNRKVRRLRKELGPEGYGIFFMLLEVLREQYEYRYPIADIDLLADEFTTSEQKIQTVISGYGLFNVDENKMFFSNMVVYLRPYLEGKQKKKISGIKGNLIRYGYCKKEELEGKTPLEIIKIADNNGFSHSESHTEGLAITNRSQLKESKVKKVNEIKERKVNNYPSQKNNYGNFIPKENKPYGQFTPKAETQKKPDTKPEEHMDPLSIQIQAMIEHWNNKGNLPNCPYTVLSMPNIGEVNQVFAGFKRDRVCSAIDNLSTYWDQENFKPTSFQRFIIKSVDRWEDECKPWERYNDSKPGMSKNEKDLETYTNILIGFRETFKPGDDILDKAEIKVAELQKLVDEERRK